MNCAIIIGRLTKDPELRYIPTTGNPVSTFTVAVNRPFKNKEGNYEADFIQVQAWGKQAENCANYLQKGQQVGVKGRIQTRSYEDKEGSKRYITEIISENVEFLGKPTGEGINGSQPDQEAPQYEPIGSFDDSDMPF